MSRVHYAFNAAEAARYAKPQGPKLRMPMRVKMRNRRYLRSAMEAAGLFAFGFGATALVSQIAAHSSFLYWLTATIRSAW